MRLQLSPALSRTLRPNMRAEYASLLRPEQLAMGCERQIQSGRRSLRDDDELQGGGIFSEEANQATT